MLSDNFARKCVLTVSCHCSKTAKTGCFLDPVLEQKQEFSGLTVNPEGQILAKVARVFRVSENSIFKAKSRDGGHFLARQMEHPTPKSSRERLKIPFLNF